MGAVAQRHPDLQIVIDHLGLPRPPRVTWDQLWSEAFPALVDLAVHPNIALKLTAMPGLSSEGFPYRDLWPYVHRLISAFGAERLMWGTDWTAHRRWPIEHQIAFIKDTGELSTSEKELILGQTLRRVFGWAAPHGPR
jgi:L-fuconolactonase